MKVKVLQLDDALMVLSETIMKQEYKNGGTDFADAFDLGAKTMVEIIYNQLKSLNGSTWYDRNEGGE